MANELQADAGQTEKSHQANLLVMLDDVARRYALVESRDCDSRYKLRRNTVAAGTGHHSAGPALSVVHCTNGNSFSS